jgi:hypothetical protein
MLDRWPRSGAIVDFGIDSQQHYDSLYYPIRNGEIAPSVLDAAMGHGEKLTELVRNAPSNPHKNIRFYTSWDELLGRDDNAPRTDYQKALDAAADRGSNGRIESDHSFVFRKSLTWWTRRSETLSLPMKALNQSRCSRALCLVSGLVR